MLVVPFLHADSCTFSYVVADKNRKRAAIVDPVADYDACSSRINHELADRLLAFLRSRDLSLDWILETHAHADHLTAAAYLKDQTGAPVVIGAGITEVQRAFRGVYHLGPDFPVDGSQFDRLVVDGDLLPLGDGAIEVLATPGHTNDSVTYRFGDAAFVGDTLFMPYYGTARCDFPGGDAGMLYDSIQTLYQLPAHTRLYLCHDYPPAGQDACCETTVAESRRSNIHLKRDTERADFIAMRNERDRTLSMPKLILQAVQVNIRAGQLPPCEENGVSYLRLPVNAELRKLAR